MKEKKETVKPICGYKVKKSYNKAGKLTNYGCTIKLGKKAKWISGKTRIELKEKVLKAISEYDKEKQISLKQTESFITMYRIYIEECENSGINKYSPSTIRNKKKFEKDFMFFDSVPLKKLDAVTIIRWQKELLRKNKKGTVLTKTNVLLAFLKYCEERNYIKINFTRKGLLDLGEGENNYLETAGVFTIEEFNEMMRYEKIEKYKVIYNLLFYTGARKSEICGLTKKDFIKITKGEKNMCFMNIENTTQYVHGYGNMTAMKTKNKSSERQIPISEELYKIAILWCDKNNIAEEERLFEKPIYNNLDAHHKQLRKRILKKHQQGETFLGRLIALKGFRHSYVTIKLENGTGIEFVQKALGHSSQKYINSTYWHAHYEEYYDGVMNNGKNPKEIKYENG